MPLRQLYPDPKSAPSHAPPARIDIISVHGLGPRGKGETKHAFDTWRTPSGQKGRLWLQQDLPAHIPDSRIFLYQYNVTATYGQGLDNFRSKANNLFEVISIERRDCPERPILLLGHSMGGLLIKQALVNAHSNPGYSAIKDATTGLAFFGTPHEAVARKLGETAAVIAKDFGYETGDDLVDSLQTGSIFPELESWKHQVLQYDIVTFWGTSDTMISRECVSLGLPGDVAKIVELDASHRGLCKFGSTEKDQYNLKIVVENIKGLYRLAIEKFESQGVCFPDTSGVETPCTSEDDSQDELHDRVQEREIVTLSTTNETEQLIMTPSRESLLQDDEVTVQGPLIRSFDHSTAREGPSLESLTVDDFRIADIQVIEPETKDNFYSQRLFKDLGLPEPVLQRLLYLNYPRPTKVQEALLSLFASDPLHNVIMEYPPGTGRTTALVIALLSRIDYSSTTQPQVLVIVPDRLLVHQMGNHIKEIGSFCDGLVVQTVHILVEKTAKFEANVIVATPGILLDKIQRRLIKTSEVRLLVVDDVDYVEDRQGLSDQCIRVSRMLPKSFQFLLSSDLLRRASAFARSLTLSKAWEKLELKEAELNVNKVVHLFFRCKHEQEKLDIICKLPGLVQISMLIIFVGMRSSAHQIHKMMATEGHVVTNLFNADDKREMEGLLEEFKNGHAKVLITMDDKTRGLDLPYSSMVINYDIPTKGYLKEPDLGPDRYVRQVSRAGKAGRSGFAVNLVSNEKEVDALQSVAASRSFKLHELDSNDWDEVEQFLTNCARSRRF